jgi:hypothetical protein
LAFLDHGLVAPMHPHLTVACAIGPKPTADGFGREEALRLAFFQAHAAGVESSEPRSKRWWNAQRLSTAVLVPHRTRRVILCVAFTRAGTEMSENHYARFEVTGRLALAGAHLVRHWTNPKTAPDLETSDGMLFLRVDKRGVGLQDLRKTIEVIRASSQEMVESADAWLAEIDRLIAADGSS